MYNPQQYVHYICTENNEVHVASFLPSSPHRVLNEFAAVSTLLC
jgi:hypothetical protein